MSNHPEEERYRPAAIEARWQQVWESRGTNTLTSDQLRTAKSPFYNLMMFPYPSAEGLHVGNIYAFTGADVHGRFRKLQGQDVFEPIGFDAFGIHSENFAMKVGVHPMDLIPRNIANFTRQLRRTGGMFDWNHVVDTTHPDYYRWTQWLFLQLYKGGYAERKEAPVNWCPSCKTVLANEQVIGGLCERCDSAVEQRRIAQWFFKISDFSERLLKNLDGLDWSPTTKRAQENWIGRSEGALVRFSIVREEGAAGRATSPMDSPTVSDTPANTPAPDFIEVFTTRPDTLFGATYMVLAPEHPLVDTLTSPNRRDEVEAYRAEVAKLDLIARKKTDKSKSGVFTGGTCMNPATGEVIPIWISDYVLMEYGTGAVMAVPAHDERDFEFASTYGLPFRRVIADDSADREAPLTEAFTDEGRLVASSNFDGMGSAEARSAIVEWLAQKGAAEKRINYRLHDWCVSRQRYWGPPIPIVYCEMCGPVPVPEDQLPVLLPRVEDYRPDDSGISPLARDHEWYRTACPECGGAAARETDVSDTFLDSAWYFLRYPSTDRTDVPFDSEITEKWLPVHSYIGGNEHAVLHLLYSRFVTMALHDMGHISFEEPFARFRAHGLIVRDGAKMSKSRGNVIVPDPIIEEYGADTFRLYLMFLGPFEEGGDYRDQGIQGPFNFVKRIWESVVPVDRLGEGAPDPAVERKLHQTIRKVTEQLADLQYNTSIAAMMEYLNVLRAGGRTPARSEVEPLIPLVAPFCPHVAEELWFRLGHAESIFEGTHWPNYDPEKTLEDTVTLAVQVNGKVRGTIRLPAGAPEADALAAARADSNVSRYLGDSEPRRIIYVPDRLLNFVVSTS